ncbi:MAG: PspC domain-containing protein [Nitrolancea sp.]
MEQEKPRTPIGPMFEPSRPSTYDEVHRRLSRSKNDQVIAGVCGGLGHYFGVDPVLVRIGFVALAFAGGAGILVYILAAIIMPEAKPEEDVARSEVVRMGQGKLIFGGLLVAIGAVLLLREVLPWFSDQVIWATILIALGLGVIFKGTQR